MDPSDYRDRYLQRITPAALAASKTPDRGALLSLVDHYFPDYDSAELYIDTLGRSDLLRLIEHCGVTPVNQRITSVQVLAGIQALRDAGEQRQTTIDRLYAELARWQAETDRLRTELAKCGGEIEKLSNDVIELRSELAALYESTSWRITQPIRRLLTMLRN